MNVATVLVLALMKFLEASSVSFEIIYRFVEVLNQIFCEAPRQTRFDNHTKHRFVLVNVGEERQLFFG